MKAIVVKSASFDDFHAALALMHDDASAQWDIDIGEPMPDGDVTVIVKSSNFVELSRSLGNVYVSGEAFVYDCNLLADGNVKWTKNSAVVIYNNYMK